MQDPDQAGIALVDLGSARQQPQSRTWAPVDEEHFQRHPGLTVLQMAWHPGDALSGPSQLLHLTSGTCINHITDS